MFNRNFSSPQLCRKGTDFGSAESLISAVKKKAEKEDQQFFVGSVEDRSAFVEGDIPYIPTYPMHHVIDNGKEYVDFVVISDTHGMHKTVNVPPGDVLIHCGDFTTSGRGQEVVDFNEWLGKLPHKIKIVIAGNHEITFQRSFYEKNWHRFHVTKCDVADPRALLTNCIYLEDSGVCIDGINIWGSPWQPSFLDWAFNLDRGEPIRRVWDMIPSNTHILITHGPPWGFGDKEWRGHRVGCDDLLKAAKRIKPVYHLFGHIHEDYGEFYDGATTYINASSCNRSNRCWNSPFQLRLDKKPMTIPVPISASAFRTQSSPSMGANQLGESLERLEIISESPLELSISPNEGMMFIHESHDDDAKPSSKSQS